LTNASTHLSPNRCRTRSVRGRVVDRVKARLDVSVEHPASSLITRPVLRLARAAATDTAASTTTNAAATNDSGDGWGTGLGIAGAGLGVAALVVALLAHRKSAIRSPHRHEQDATARPDLGRAAAGLVDRDEELFDLI
jgi:hypothetical protein